MNEDEWMVKGMMRECSSSQNSVSFDCLQTNSSQFCFYAGVLSSPPRILRPLVAFYGGRPWLYSTSSIIEVGLTGHDRLSCKRFQFAQELVLDFMLSSYYV